MIGRVLATIKIGVHKTHDSYLDALSVACVKVNAFDKHVFKSMPLAQHEIELALIEASVAELGFTDLARFGAILRRAKAQGLDSCPPETGAALRLAYRDQPKEDAVSVTADVPAESDGALPIFGVGHEGAAGGLWFKLLYCRPSTRFPPDGKLIFVQHRE